MTLYRTLVIVAGMLLVVMAHIAPSTAMAAENDSAATGQSAAGALEASQEGGDASVKPKKAQKKEPPPEPEPLPGQKLTFKQVTTILKTTRNLSGRNLSGLKLTGVDLSRCNLKGADLRGADLERADLGAANLERADLSNANLKMANLRLSGVVGAKLDNAILDGAVWTDGRICVPSSIGQCREPSSPYISP